MKIQSVCYSSSFKKSIRKYSADKKQIQQKITEFQKNPFSPSLKTHKLSGNLAFYWSFSINYHLRILFEFIDEKTVGFIAIGSHEIYK